MYDPHLYDENGVNLAGIKNVIVTNNKTRRDGETEITNCRKALGRKDIISINNKEILHNRGLLPWPHVLGNLHTRIRLFDCQGWIPVALTGLQKQENRFLLYDLYLDKVRSFSLVDITKKLLLEA
ncbi:MAG: hypothetical protein P8J44_09645 [Gammaproteobacteria bacterium]|nr:hypothetical protein [Gammaproteobacteria bacterium]